MTARDLARDAHSHALAGVDAGRHDDLHALLRPLRHLLPKLQQLRLLLRRYAPAAERSVPVTAGLELAGLGAHAEAGLGARAPVAERAVPGTAGLVRAVCLAEAGAGLGARAPVAERAVPGTAGLVRAPS